MIFNHLLFRNYWEITNFDCSDKSISKIKIYSKFCFINFLDGKQFIFRDFVGINDWQDNWVPAKKALKILNNNIRKYYTSKENEEKINKEKKLMFQCEEFHEILMPFDVYTSKVLEEIDLLMVPLRFRNKYMKKIDQNIDFINKLMYEEKRDLDFIAKWLRTPLKIFVKSFNRYAKQIKNKNISCRLKLNQKVDRLVNIKGLIQIYIGLNKGKCINTKSILNFIQPWNL